MGFPMGPQCSPAVDKSCFLARDIRIASNYLAFAQLGCNFEVRAQLTPAFSTPNSPGLVAPMADDELRDVYGNWWQSLGLLVGSG
jgi:hypothetical protein